MSLSIKANTNIVCFAEWLTQLITMHQRDSRSAECIKILTILTLSSNSSQNNWNDLSISDENQINFNVAQSGTYQVPPMNQNPHQTDDPCHQHPENNH